MLTRVVIAVVAIFVAATAPAMAQEGPWYDVTCPTGSAQVVLDPGHGGPDPGAVKDTYGLYERILTLEVTERTAGLLRADGYTVALTRADGATELANSERGEIANACAADVFVEIHLNASLDTSDDFTQAFWAVKEKDLAFSLVMSDALATIGIPVNEVERFDNGGLIRAKMPSVLVEGVFLSNGDEAKDLANGTRQESIARAVASGVDTWLTLAAGAEVPVAPASASPMATPVASPPVASPAASPVAALPVYPPDAEIAGEDQATWMEQRWRWQLSLPMGANPGHDVTGTLCAAGQGGPVYFIPTNLPACSVPAGVPVVVPLVGGICTSGTLGDAADLPTCAQAEGDRYTAVRIWVDGEEVPGIDAWRFTTGVFEIQLPEHDVLGLGVDETEAVASGWQVILPPLSPGEHEVVVHAELTDGTVLPDARAVLTVSG
jgi:N-acetylmuramoyl-L-alanine amidase